MISYFYAFFSRKKIDEQKKRVMLAIDTITTTQTLLYSNYYIALSFSKKVFSVMIVLACKWERWQFQLCWNARVREFFKFQS